MKTSFLADHVTFLHHRYFVTGTFLDPTFNIILIPCKKSFRRRSNLGTSDKNQNKYIFSQNIVLRKLFSKIIFSTKNVLARSFFRRKKVSTPSFFRRKKVLAPSFFRRKKVSAPSFFRRKNVLAPFLPARPGVPINFARSLSLGS